MRALLLLLFMLVSLPAWAEPAVIVLHVYDDVHPQDFNAYSGEFPNSDGYQTMPNIDAMATNGIRLTGMHVESVCSPTRASLLGFQTPGRSSHLIGTVYSSLIPAETERNLPTSFPSLIRTFADAGWAVAGFGKLHIGTEQVVNNGADTLAKQLGFTVYEAMMVGNNRKAVACQALRPTMTGWGHNFWCSYDLDGNFEIKGDGTSTVGAGNGYDDAVISAAAQTYISGTALSGGNHLIVIGWNGTHVPLNDGTADTLATLYDYNNDEVADQYHDSRPPGSTVVHAAGGYKALYREKLIYTDTQIGIINGLLVGVNHLSIAIGDNGVDVDNASTQCFDSYGAKGTPYPCGTEVPFVIQGDDLDQTASGTALDGLRMAADVPKTIAQLAGLATPVRDGMSFADCLTNTGGRSVSNCPSHEVVMSENFVPIGGGSGADSTPIGTSNRAPVADDVAGEWTTHIVGANTLACNGEWFLRRYYDVTVAHGPYCDHFYEKDVADPYLATANAPIETTSCTFGSMGGALTQAGFSADQTCAYEKLSRFIDKAIVRRDPAPTYGGASR